MTLDTPINSKIVLRIVFDPGDRKLGVILVALTAFISRVNFHLLMVVFKLSVEVHSGSEPSNFTNTFVVIDG